jgi:hypothetical protein
VLRGLQKMALPRRAVLIESVRGLHGKIGVEEDLREAIGLETAIPIPNSNSATREPGG